MGWLDPIARAAAEIIREMGTVAGPLSVLNTNEEGDFELSGRIDDADELVEDAFGGLFDTLEDDITEEITRGDYLTPGTVGSRLDSAEGAVIQTAVGATTAGLGIELAGGTQLESHQFQLSQIMAFLAAEDVLGRESSMAMEKGVDPALEAEIGKQTRSEFVNLQDAIEYALREKEGDDGWLHASGANDDVIAQVGSNRPVNEENLIEEWGIRDDQLDILEKVAISEIEPEELIEEPVQFGVIPPKDTVEAELDRAGVSEDAKGLFLEVVDAMPRSADLWEQRTAVEPVVSELDKLVSEGEVTPGEATNYVPPEAEDASRALQDRWRNIQTLPNKAPTRSQLESWFGWGLINRRTLYQGLQRTDVDPNEYPAVMADAILSEIDGDLRTALGLGLIDENYFSSLAKSVGLEQDVVRDIMAGDDLDDIAKSKASEDIPLSDRPTTAVIDIGTSRAAGLSGEDIDTVGDLAQADVQTVAQATAFSDEAAETIINRAQSMVS